MSYHYHITNGDGHPDNRGLYFHDHPGSFIIENGRMVHNHAEEFFTKYIEEEWKNETDA